MERALREGEAVPPPPLPPLLKLACALATPAAEAAASRVPTALLLLDAIADALPCALLLASPLLPLAPHDEDAHGDTLALPVPPPLTPVTLGAPLPAAEREPLATPVTALEVLAEPTGGTDALEIIEMRGEPVPLPLCKLCCEALPLAVPLREGTAPEDAAGAPVPLPQFGEPVAAKAPLPLLRKLMLAIFEVVGGGLAEAVLSAEALVGALVDAMGSAEPRPVAVGGREGGAGSEKAAVAEGMEEAVENGGDSEGSGEALAWTAVGVVRPAEADAKKEAVAAALRDGCAELLPCGALALGEPPAVWEAMLLTLPIPSPAAREEPLGEALIEGRGEEAAEAVPPTPLTLAHPVNLAVPVSQAVANEEGLSLEVGTIDVVDKDEPLRAAVAVSPPPIEADDENVFPAPLLLATADTLVLLLPLPVVEAHRLSAALPLASAPLPPPLLPLAAPLPTLLAVPSIEALAHPVPLPLVSTLAEACGDADTVSGAEALCEGAAGVGVFSPAPLTVAMADRAALLEGTLEGAPAELALAQVLTSPDSVPPKLLLTNPLLALPAAVPETCPLPLLLAAAVSEAVPDELNVAPLLPLAVGSDDALSWPLPVLQRLPAALPLSLPLPGPLLPVAPPPLPVPLRLTVSVPLPVPVAATERPPLAVPVGTLATALPVPPAPNPSPLLREMAGLALPAPPPLPVALMLDEAAELGVCVWAQLPLPPV